MKAVFIKLGGSLITDKTIPIKAHAKIISNIAQEIADLHSIHKDTAFIIGNGAGSFGHFAVESTGWKKTPNNPLKIAQIRQTTSRLHTLVVDALLSCNVPAVSFPPATYMYRLMGHIHSSISPIINYSTIGVVPVLHGDVIYDDQNGSYILSTEQAFEAIAKEWTAGGHQIESIIYCTSVNGVLDAQSRTIPILTQSDTVHSYTETLGYDVTGGMAQKVKAGFNALEYCDNVYIINGTTKGNLTNAVALESVGTKLTKN